MVYVELDPSFQIFRPVSIAKCFYKSVYNHHFGEVQMQPTRNYEYRRAFLISGGPCLQRSEHRSVGKQHLEPLADQVWKLSVNFAFSWCRTKWDNKYVEESVWNLRVKV